MSDQQRQNRRDEGDQGDAAGLAVVQHVVVQDETGHGTKQPEVDNRAERARWDM